MPGNVVEPDVISYNAAMSACVKAGQWQLALGLLSLMPLFDRISCSIAISACASAAQWKPALELLKNMPELRIFPNVISYSAAITSCEKGGQWQ
ncbi:unnamed protein product, partial [Polarella glacialis]